MLSPLAMWKKFLQRINLDKVAEIQGCAVNADFFKAEQAEHGTGLALRFLLLLALHAVMHY